MATKTAANHTLFKNLWLLLVSVLISLVMCEVIVRVAVPVRYVGPTFSIYDPIYGKAQKKNFSALRITPEFTMRFTTNSQGLRGPELAPVPDRPIVFLGDSFTIGYGVNDGEEYPALIRTALEERYGEGQVPVVNVSLAGNGQGRWLKFLRNEGKRFNPRLIVLQFFYNDFNDNVQERLFNLTPDGKLEELPVPPPPNERIIQRVIESLPPLSYSYIVGLVKQILTSTIGGHDALSRELNSDNAYSLGAQLTFRLLEEVLALCTYERWPVLALIVDINGQRLTELEKIFRSYQVPIISVPGQKERPELYYPVDRHWTPSGHTIVAKLIVEQLSALNLLSPETFRGIQLDYLPHEGI